MRSWLKSLEARGHERAEEMRTSTELEQEAARCVSRQGLGQCDARGKEKRIIGASTFPLAVRRLSRKTPQQQQCEDELNSPSSAQHGRLIELDSLRGLAATAVLLFHVTYFNDQQHASPVAIWWGHYGVELFFVISGFVILMTIEKSSNLWQFVVSRFARLYPTYWCAVLLTTLVIVTFRQSEIPSPARLLANLTMFHSFMFMRISSIDGSYWTLTRELLFYLMIGAWFRWRRPQFPDIEPYALCWIAVVVLIRLGTRVLGRQEAPSIIAAPLLMDYGQFFVIGMSLYRFYSGRSTRATWLMLAGACLLSLFGGDFKSLSPEPISYFLLTCLMAAAVWGAVRYRPAILRNEVLLFCGSISYPLYLIHQRISTDLIAYSTRSGRSWLESAVGIVGAIVIVSYAVHRFIEEPGRRYLRSRLIGKPQAMPADRYAIGSLSAESRLERPVEAESWRC